MRVDPTQFQSSQEAQWAATQASLNDVQNSRNAVSSAQQSLVVAEAGVSQAKQQAVTSQIDLKTAERELKRAIEPGGSECTRRIRLGSRLL